MSAACVPIVKRDLSRIPAGQVGFDDMCGLQVYFDDIEARKEAAPALVSSTELETQREGHALRMGRSRFAFEGRAQLATLRRVLDENWARLPEEVVRAPRVDLDVYWSERDGLRRVVSNKDALLVAPPHEVAIPYHVCLSELLYGAPLYHQRRQVMGLPPILPASPDGGQAPSGGASAGPPRDGEAPAGPTDGRPRSDAAPPGASDAGIEPATTTPVLPPER